MATETTSLLGSHRNSQEEPGNHSVEEETTLGRKSLNCCIKFCNLVFYALCLFTGQLFVEWNCRKKKPDRKSRKYLCVVCCDHSTSSVVILLLQDIPYFHREQP